MSANGSAPAARDKQMWASGYYGLLSDYLWWWVVLAAVAANTWGFLRLTRRWSARKTRLVIGNMLVLLILLLTAGMVGESYLRFVSVATDPHGVTLTHQRWQAAFASVNSLAYRDKEWIPGDPPYARRVAFVGDSFTYGWGIDDPQNRFTELVQRWNDEQIGTGMEVMNVAWAGWSTKDQIPAVKYLIELYGIDEVVLCHLPNDIEDCLPRRAGVDLTKPPRPAWFRPECSFLFDYLYYRLYVPWARGGAEYFDWLADGYADPQAWTCHSQQLQDLRELCAARGVEFDVVLVPFLKIAGTRLDQWRIHAQLTEWLREQHVEYVDLLYAIRAVDPSNLVVRRDDPHPNETAHRLFAEAIWEALYRPKY